MPSVEILALLCERSDAVPPRPDTVEQWGRKYLKSFDAHADEWNPDPDSQARRRKAIENTFRWLQGVSDTDWQTEGES